MGKNALNQTSKTCTIFVINVSEPLAKQLLKYGELNFGYSLKKISTTDEEMLQTRPLRKYGDIFKEMRWTAIFL